MISGNNHFVPSQKKQLTLLNLKDHFQNYYRSLDATAPINNSGIRSDFARLGRRILSKSIGLVLGGNTLFNLKAGEQGV